MALDTYLGGKNAEGVWHKIINELAPHTRYFEGFVGSGAILRRKKPARYSFAFDRSPAVIDELATVTVPNLRAMVADVLDVLDGRILIDIGGFGPGDLWYFDAPYLRGVRTSSKTRYEFEFDTPEQHQALLSRARRLAGSGAMVAISHYPCEFYDHELAGWRRVDYQVGIRNGQSRTESLYTSYPRPRELHDARFIGRDFRHREKLNRRVATMMGKLDRMFADDPQFVHAYLAAIDEWRSQNLNE